MTIDYEKVDMNLLGLIQQLNNLQNFIMLPSLNSISGAGHFITALDDFRKGIAEEIEEQGSSE